MVPHIHDLGSGLVETWSPVVSLEGVVGKMSASCRVELLVSSVTSSSELASVI